MDPSALAEGHFSHENRSNAALGASILGFARQKRVNIRGCSLEGWKEEAAFCSWKDRSNIATNWWNITFMYRGEARWNAERILPTGWLYVNYITSFPETSTAFSFPEKRPRQMKKYLLTFEIIFFWIVNIIFLSRWKFRRQSYDSSVRLTILRLYYFDLKQEQRSGYPKKKSTRDPGIRLMSNVCLPITDVYLTPNTRVVHTIVHFISQFYDALRVRGAFYSYLRERGNAAYPRSKEIIYKFREYTFVLDTFFNKFRAFDRYKGEGRPL